MNGGSGSVGTTGEITLVAGDEDAGQRLDRFLSSKITSISRSRIKALILSGQVTRADATLRDANGRVKPGETITVSVPPPQPDGPEPQAIALQIVYEDEHVIVLDKPAGQVVHPAAGHASGTLVNALLAHCGDSLSGIGGVRRPGIVHRLDKDTSGLLVVAKNDAAHKGLSEQFAAHGADGRLERVYAGVCWRVPLRIAGTIDARLARSASNRKKIAVVEGESGRRAVTHYRVQQRFGDRGALLELRLETGRTHQIRVHLAHIGHPLMGDPVYAAGFKASAGLLTPDQQDALQKLGRQALHARVLGFVHPATGKPLRLESRLPADMRHLIDTLSVKS